MLAQLGYGTPTLQRFWGCDENNVGGTLGVLVNGVHTPGPTLAAGTDYTGTVDAAVSGTYTWQLTLNGAAVTPLRTNRAMPGPGERFKSVFWADATADGYGFYNMQKEDPDFATCGGDWDYIDTEAGFVRDANLSSYRPRHRNKLTTQKRRASFFASVPYVVTQDSHEGVRGDLYAPGTAIYAAAYQANREYFLSLNPANNDSGVHVTPSPAPYFRHTVSDVEFIFLDAISWITVGREQFDATQLAWFDAALQNSTASCIVVWAPQQPVAASILSWADVFRSINAITKTVVILSGDSHGAVAVWRPQGTTLSGGTITNAFTNRGVLEVQATPIDHSTMTAGDAITLSQSTVHFIDNSDSAVASGTYGDNRNYGVLAYEPNGSALRATPHIQIDIKNAWNAALRWRCFVDIGSRAPVIYDPRGGVPR